jgi:hypothetical protein
MSYVRVLANGACPILRREVSGLGQSPPAAPNFTAAAATAASAENIQTSINPTAAGQDVASIMAKLTKQMRDLALEQAAINTSMSIAFNFIPIVGQAVSALLSILTAILGSYYSDQCKTAVTNFTNSMQLMAATYNAQVTAAQDAAVQAQLPGAIQLTLSGKVPPPPPATGTNGLGHTWEDTLSSVVHWLANPLKMLHPVLRLNHEVITDLNDVLAKSKVPALVSLAGELQKANSTLYQDTVKGQAAIDQLIDISTGQAALTKTQEAIAQATAQCTAEFQSQTAIAIANINSPTFLAALQFTIAQALLQDPSVSDLVASQGKLFSPSGLPTIPGATTPSKWLLALPAVGAVAGVLAIAHANR